MGFQGFGDDQLPRPSKKGSQLRRQLLCSEAGATMMLEGTTGGLASRRQAVNQLPNGFSLPSPLPSISQEVPRITSQEGLSPSNSGGSSSHNSSHPHMYYGSQQQYGGWGTSSANSTSSYTFSNSHSPSAAHSSTPANLTQLMQPQPQAQARPALYNTASPSMPQLGGLRSSSSPSDLHHAPPSYTNESTPYSSGGGTGLSQLPTLASQTPSSHAGLAQPSSMLGAQPSQNAAPQTPVSTGSTATLPPDSGYRSTASSSSYFSSASQYGNDSTNSAHHGHHAAHAHSSPSATAAASRGLLSHAAPSLAYPGPSGRTYGGVSSPPPALGSVMSTVHSHPGGAPVQMGLAMSAGAAGALGYSTSSSYHPLPPQHPAMGSYAGHHQPYGAYNSHAMMAHQSYGLVHHTGPVAQDRPFKCDQCMLSFNRNHDLKRHKRIHLSVKPYPCDQCGKRFSRKDALKRHRLVKGCGEKDEHAMLQDDKEAAAGKNDEEASLTSEEGSARPDTPLEREGPYQTR